MQVLNSRLGESCDLDAMPLSVLLHDQGSRETRRVSTVEGKWGRRKGEVQVDVPFKILMICPLFT